MDGSCVPTVIKKSYERQIFVSGGNGEVSLACGHSYRNLCGTLSELSINHFVSHYFHGETENIKNIRRIIAHEFENMPDVPLNTMSDLFYMYYRNRFHFSNKYNSRPTVHLCNSKSAFLLKRIRFNNIGKQDYTVQLDINHLLNAEIAEFPSRAKNQKDRIRESKKDLLCKDWYANEQILPDLDRKAYDAARHHTSVAYLPDKDTYDNMLRDSDDGAFRAKYLSSGYYLGALKYVLEKIPGISHEEGFELYKWAFQETRPKVSETGNSYSARLNKLLSAAAAISLAEES